MKFGRTRNRSGTARNVGVTDSDNCRALQNGTVLKSVEFRICLKVSVLVEPGASKGTPGDAKCVTEILGGTKIRKLGGQSLKLLPPDVIF